MTTQTLDPGAAAPAAPAAISPGRDLRLDVFRGLAMFIILISHTPGNAWGRWIPAQFGFSDAAEIFVFCSGMASAIAFGGAFARAGFALGTARVGFRVWQVYWCHIGLFVVTAAVLAGLDLTGAFEARYVDSLALGYFFAAPEPMLLGLLTLTYVPNYFDILPMYLVILAMLPVAVALARVHPYAAIAASLILWAVANAGLLALPADPLGDRQWFFNPFGWQLIFFTGYAFMAGWLPPPPVSRVLVLLALAYVVLTTPLSSGHVVGWLNAVWPAGGQWAMEVYPDMLWLRTKTEQGILRYVHFLSLAYLAWVASGPQGRNLLPRGSGAGAQVWDVVLAAIVKVGQQALAVFVVSMVAARLMGVALDLLPQTAAAQLAVNLAGIATLVATAYAAAWFKSQPWKVRAARA